MSERLLPHVTDVVIRKEVLGSDHCPLVMGLADHAHLPHPQHNDEGQQKEKIGEDKTDS